MMLDADEPVNKRACIFCGSLEETNHRSLFLEDVLNLVLNQHAKGIVEPVNTAMRNILSVPAPHSPRAEGDGAEQERVVNTCMCCFHWVNKRQYNEFVRFPMQNLFWYTKSFSLLKRRNYDARILHRLARAVTQPQGPSAVHNFYITLFYEEEVALLQQVAAAPVAELHNLFARHYYEHNGSPLFLPDARVTDAVRTGLKEFCCDEDTGDMGVRVVTFPNDFDE